MSTTLKQANRGGFLLIGAFVASLLSAAGLFMIFAMGMGGGALGESERAGANVIFIVLVIATPVFCLVTPVAGVWGFVLVVISTIKEISADRNLSQAAESPAASGDFKISFGRVRQAAAIGLALFTVFYIVSVVLLSILDGESALFASWYNGTIFFPLAGLPILMLLGSIGAGILNAQRAGRETAVAAGALAGGALMGLLGIVGFAVFLILKM